jgi:Tol biopolymer transport system component
MMTPERFQLISQIYHEALRRPEGDRDSFLEERCGPDQELRREVEYLLSGGKDAEAEMLSRAMKESVRRLSDESPLSLLGQTLDHYQVMSLSGKGGMGEVYRARDINLGREVAIKLLPESFPSGPDRLRFEREARAASALNHPNILTIHDIEQVDKYRFIVSEFIDGDTLRKRLTKGPMRVSEALDIASQVASALAAAHDAGIMHRDIKPENIMLRRDGLVKVLDFGLAKGTESALTSTTPEQSTVEFFETDAGMVLGTSAYMSPEQSRGQAVDERTDIWSLGVVLYEMITGTQPFTGETKSDVIVSILQKEPAALKDRTFSSEPALKRILQKALQKNVAERYQSAKDLLEDLKALRQDLDTQKMIKPVAGVSARSRAITYLLVAGIIAVAGFAIYSIIGRNLPPPASPATRSTPFTSYTGREQQPSFSPDGKQIAFSWNGDKGDNFDIYIKLVNSETRPLRLTSDPAEDIYPAWSPDGTQIAFVRHQGPQITILTIPVLGGQERKLYSGTSAFYSLYEFGNALSWSPDGKFLAFSGQPGPRQPNGIFLLSTETLEKRQLTTPPEGFLGDSTPAFSPDGKLLAFVRGASSRDVEVYVMPAGGGEPTRLTFDNRSGRSLAWTGDSKSIVFSSWFYGGLLLWRVDAAGGKPEQLNVGGEFASTLAVSRKGDELAFSQEFRDTNIWRIELNGATAKSSATKLISSTRQDYSPQYSPDNKRIAFTSSRTGDNEIWMCDVDGQNPVPITSFGGPDVGSPHWSPDSQKIAFDSLAPGHRDIYVTAVDGGKPRRLTGDTFDNVRPSWSHDGNWIYFGSNRSGDWQLWKARAEGGEPVRITKQGGREGVESSDAKFIYYTKGFGVPGIWKVPVAGGDESQVLDGVYQGFWGLVDHGIYFVNPNATPRAVIQYFNFDTGRVTKVAEIERELQLVYPSFGVSPDGKSLLFVQADSFESDIMLVEGFR